MFASDNHHSANHRVRLCVIVVITVHLLTRRWKRERRKNIENEYLHEIVQTS